MRRLGILLLAWVAGMHAAGAQCIDVALLEPKQQVELTIRGFDGSKSITKRRTIKRVKNFEFVATEGSRGEGLENRFEENSILNLLPLWSDHSFFSNDSPQKKRVKTSTIEKSYMYGHVNKVLEDMILKKKDFTVNQQIQAHDRWEKNKKSIVNEMNEIKIEFFSNDTIEIDGCKYEVVILDRSSTLIDTDSPQFKQYIGIMNRSRIYYSKHLLYPLRSQSLKDGRWIDYATVTSARVVR
jgi:hypothetical protein